MRYPKPRTWPLVLMVLSICLVAFAAVASTALPRGTTMDRIAVTAGAAGAVSGMSSWIMSRRE